MKDNFNSMRKDVDEYLVNTLKDDRECGIISFSCFLKKVFSSFNIGVASFNGEDVLVVYGENAFQKIHAIYYYLLDLERNNYLLYVDLPDKADSVDYGDTCQSSSGKLSIAVSSFIRKHSGENVCVSPLIKDYIDAHHCSPELQEARKQRGVTIVATVIAALAAAVSLLFPHCC